MVFLRQKNLNSPEILDRVHYGQAIFCTLISLGLGYFQIDFDFE